MPQGHRAAKWSLNSALVCLTGGELSLPPHPRLMTLESHTGLELDTPCARPTQPACPIRPRSCVTFLSGSGLGGLWLLSKFKPTITRRRRGLGRFPKGRAPHPERSIPTQTEGPPCHVTKSASSFPTQAPGDTGRVPLLPATAQAPKAPTSGSQLSKGTFKKESSIYPQ